ncbi:MAG: hypothetical protein ACRDPY_38545 [Streptosporangiaceae bacterium]
MGGDGAAGGVGEGWHAQVDGGVLAGGEPVELGELVLCCGEADLESFGFAEPSFAEGFGDSDGEVVADLDQAGPPGLIRAEQGAAQAALTEMILALKVGSRCSR